MRLVKSNLKIVETIQMHVEKIIRFACGYLNGLEFVSGLDGTNVIRTHFYHTSHTHQQELS